MDAGSQPHPSADRSRDTKKRFLRLYQQNRQHLVEPARRGRVASLGLCALGAGLLVFAAFRESPAAALLGALLTLTGIGFFFTVQRRKEARLVLMRVRVIGLSHTVSPDESSAEVELLRRLRIRPDGYIRHDPPMRSRVTLALSRELYARLQTRSDAAEPIELLAAGDHYAFGLHEEDRR